MDPRQAVDFVRGLEKELTLFNLAPPDPVDERLSELFQSQNVTVTTERTTSGSPADVAVLSTAEGVLEVLDVETLRGLVSHSRPSGGSLGVSDAEYDAVLRHLKETTFVSSDTAEMLYASREIEDRARRTGEGTVHAGFQRCSRMLDQREIYRDLSRTGLSVHAYGLPDVAPPDFGGAEVHAVTSEEIADTWFVVFDGGGQAAQKSALLAEERARGTFYGVLTYDPVIVDSVCDYLAGAYLSSGERSPRSDA